MSMDFYVVIEKDEEEAVIPNEFIGVQKLSIQNEPANA